VPRYMTQAECENLIRQALPPAAKVDKPVRGRAKKAA
jgi:hypothetical protein